jgi:hypothetical protein
MSQRALTILGALQGVGIMMLIGVLIVGLLIWKLWIIYKKWSPRIKPIILGTMNL